MISSERAQGVIFKGTEDRRTIWDSEVLWWGAVLEETWIPVCFCTELEQKVTFQNFPLKGKWENFKFRKMGKHGLSFPKWNSCHNCWLLALPCFLGAHWEAPNLLEAAQEAPWSAEGCSGWSRGDCWAPKWVAGNQEALNMSAMIWRLLSSILLVCSGSHCGKVVVQCRIWEGGFAAVNQPKWKETELCFQQESACLGKMSHPFCDIFIPHYSP